MMQTTSIRPEPALPLAQGKDRLMRTPGRCLIALSSLLLASTVWAAGKPDFTGVWESYPRFHEPASAPGDLFGQGNTDAFLRPGGEPQLREPYASAYTELQKKKRAAAERGEHLVTQSIQCLPEGMPSIVAAILPFEIVQTPKVLVLLYENLMEIRRVYLNEEMPPLDDIVPSYSGYSVGRWEGDTLVVETRGVREEVTYLDMPHSANMKVTERLRLIAPDMIEAQIAIDDPGVLAKPYAFTYKYKKNPTYRLAEFVCDNNRYRLEDNGTPHLDVTPKN